MSATAAQTLADIVAVCGEGMPLPPRGDEQVFAEPWQAQVFAMTVVLHERGLFTWPQWAQRLGRHVASGASDGSDIPLVGRCAGGVARRSAVARLRTSRRSRRPGIRRPAPRTVD